MKVSKLQKEKNISVSLDNAHVIATRPHFPALMATKRKVAEKKETAPKKQAPAAAEAKLVDGARSAESFLTSLR